MTAARKVVQKDSVKTEDQQTADRLQAFVNFLAENYFRAVTIVEDRALDQTTQPVIFACNHSGMNFPWDCIVLCEDLLRRFEGRLKVKPLAAPILSANPLLSLFALPEFWNYFTAPATMLNFETLMQNGTSVMINPEGIGGIGKGFNKKYQLQPFSSSFVRMCLKYNRPLIPISVVNGEYLNPFAYSFKFINQIVHRMGVPFLPLGPTVPLFALFPALAYISLPARLHFIIGPRLDLKKLTNKSYDDLSVTEIKEITDKVQSLMQEHLNQSVAKYGASPFDWMGFFKSFRKLRWKSMGLIPLTWPALAHRAYLGKQFSWRKTVRSFFLCVVLCTPILGWPLLIAIMMGLSAKKHK